MLPISELRGGIPYAYYNDLPLPLCILIPIISNALVIPFIWLFLSTVNKLFLKMKWYENLYNKFSEKALSKIKDKVDKYGYVGLMIFVGIPLPVTGVWTATFGAWLLQLSKRKTFLFLSLGVLISATIVTTMILLNSSLLSIVIKK